MNNKIQMTEEQFYNMAIICFKREPLQIEIVRARENGYIIKSELHQKVEEAEEKYKEWQKAIDNHSGSYNIHDICLITHELYETVQLLKRSHPEFKEESDGM